MRKTIEPSILAIIPARGGSKGIPLKNLREIAGRSLLAHALELTLSIDEVSAVCVSTDHAKIREVAEGYKGVQVVDRPDSLSGDRVADIPVLKHALHEMESRTGRNFQTVLMLQVTSPLRTARDVSESIRELDRAKCDVVWTVSASDLHFHPLKQLVVDDDKNFDFYDRSGAQIVARQELKQLFHRNGSCYAFRRDFVVQAESLHSPESSRAVVSNGVRVNIDTEKDLEMAEKLLMERSEAG